MIQRNKPILTFNPARGLIYINAAALKRLPDMEYAFLLISPSEKRLRILPCGIGRRDAIRLRSGGQRSHQPRPVKCRVEFINELLSLMNWERGGKYQITGSAPAGNSGETFAFDLLSAEAGGGLDA